MLSEKKKQWLIRVVGVPPVQAIVGEPGVAGLTADPNGSLLDQQTGWEAKEQRKEKRLAAVRKKLEDSKAQIHQLLDLEVEVEDNGEVKTIKFFSDASLWDPQNEFDPGAHMKKLSRDIPPEELAQVQKGLEKIAEMHHLLNGSIPQPDWADIFEENEGGKSVAELADERMVSEAAIEQAIERHRRLQKGVSDLAGGELKKLIAPIEDEPLFDDLELRQEYYDPLVREKIVPDSQIPDRYNQTVQQFKGGSESYEERLGEHSATLTDEHEKLEALKKTGVLVKNLAKVAGSVTEVIGKLATEGSDLAARAELAGKIIKDVEVLSALGCATAQGVYEKKAGTAIDKVADVLYTFFKQYTNPGLAGAVKGVYVAAVRTAQFAASISSGTPEGVTEAIKQAGDALENALGSFGDDTLGRVGKSLNQLFQSGVNAQSVLKAWRRDPPGYETILKIFASAATAACKAVLSDSAIQDSSEGVGDATPQPREGEAPPTEGEGAEKLQDAKDQFDQDVGDALDQLSEPGEQIASVLAAQLQETFGSPEKIKEAQELAEAEVNRKARAEIEAELNNEPAYLAELRLSLTEGGSEDLEKVRAEFDNIDKMIADLESRQNYVKIAEAVYDAGLGIGAQFAGVLKLATAGKDLIKNVIAAARLTTAIAAWKTKRRDALAAASVQGFAFANRLENLQFQTDDAQAKKLLNIAQVLATAIGAAGPLAAALGPFGLLVGKAASEIAGKALDAKSAMMDIVRDYKKDAELKKAWDAYQKARRNPDDRIQMRDAIFKNSTLAKYAMAYAALEEDDPIAKQGMQAAGLTEEVLRSPGSNVQKVVSFLEKTWEDDPVVLRRVPIAEWQADKSGALTLDAFLANKNAAMNETKMKENTLQPISTGAIEGLLAALVKVRSDIAPAEEAVKTKREAYEADDAKIQQAINEFEAAQDLCSDADAQSRELRKEFEGLRKAWRETRQDERAGKKAEHLRTLDNNIKKKVQLLEPDLSAMVQAAGSCTGLDAYATAIEEYLTAVRDYPTRLEEVTKVLAELGKQLGGFKPKKKDGGVNDTVIQYTHGLKQEAEKQATAIESEKGRITADNRDLPAKKIKAESLNGQAPRTKTTYQRLQARLRQLSTEVAAHERECQK